MERVREWRARQLEKSRKDLFNRSTWDSEARGRGERTGVFGSAECMIWRRRQYAFSERRWSTTGSKTSGGREHSAVVSIRAGAGMRQLAPLSTQTKSNARRDSFRPAQKADTQSRPEVLYYTEIPASVGGARNSARQRPQKRTKIIPLDGSFGCGVGRRRRVDRYTDPPGVPASRIRSVCARAHCGTGSCQSGQSKDKLGAASYRELKFDCHRRTGRAPYYRVLLHKTLPRSEVCPFLSSPVSPKKLAGYRFQ